MSAAPVSADSGTGAGTGTVVICRFCHARDGDIVLDLGAQPACDYFPPVQLPGPDPTYPLRMWLCAACGLGQLAEDPTDADEPRGQEPAALVEQAADAVARVAAAGWLPATGTVAEYGSPHGGSWLGLLAERGLRTVPPGDAPSDDAPSEDRSADVIVDCFGLMHEPDQAAALAARAARLRRGGTLLVQFHSLATIMRQGQWNALRHAHFAYYSTPVLVAMLASVGLTARAAFRFALYGGTVLLAATRGGAPDQTVRDLVAEELRAGVTRAQVVGGLQRTAAATAARLAEFVASEQAAGRRVFGYSAASRAVALLCRAGLGPAELPAIADAAPAKRGRRLPGSAIPVISPQELVAARPHAVLLFVPDLLAEVRRSLPEIEASGARWIPLDGPWVDAPAVT